MSSMSGLLLAEDVALRLALAFRVAVRSGHARPVSLVQNTWHSGHRKHWLAERLIAISTGSRSRCSN